MRARSKRSDQPAFPVGQKDSGINIITLNVRKNPYSKDGRALAGAWWNINVTWPWIEDYEPYPLTGKYIDYSTLEGGFANPTLILIDKEGKVAGLYHVYQLGKGEIDGIQSAESLYSDLKSIERGDASGFKGVTSSQSVNYLGMFFLGIVTSLSPCSVALLLAMFSYVMTARRKEEYLKKSASASKEGFMIGVAFTLGMAVVFFVVGLFLSDIGVFIRQARFFDLAAGLLMIILGINIIKPIGEIIEPVRSHLSFRKTVPDDLPSEKKGLMERLVHFSMSLFQYSAFIGAFTLGVFFRFRLGTLRCVPGLSGAHLAYLPECDALGRRHDALRLWRRSWSTCDSYCYLLSSCGRADRREVHLCRQVRHQGLRAGGNRDRPGLCGKVPGFQDVVGGFNDTQIRPMSIGRLKCSVIRGPNMITLVKVIKA